MDNTSGYRVTGVTGGSGGGRIPASVRPSSISVSIAAQRAGKAPDTVIRWCKDYRIGKQLGPKNPWRVDPVGLEILMEGDAEALAMYQGGSFDHPLLQSYRERLKRYDVR